MKLKLADCNPKLRARILGSMVEKPPEPSIVARKPLSITFPGQVMGGKNNLIVTRTGRRFPRASWARWRDLMVQTVKRQLPPDWTPINEFTALRLDYWAGDRRIRDQPAVIDAILHVLEKAGFAENDCFLWFQQAFKGYDKANPRAVVTIL